MPHAVIRRRVAPSRSSTVAVSVLLALMTALLPGTPARAADSRADGPHARPWWYDAMKLDQAHQQATGKGVTIAVIDNGLQPDVPGLEGADITMMKSPCLGGRVAAYTPGERARHGTVMTSLLVGNGTGTGGPGTGIMGVAPDAAIKFYDVDDERQPATKTDGNACDFGRSVGRTVLDAIDDGADIVSMSFGNPQDLFTTPMLVKAAKRAGAVLVASSTSEDELGAGTAERFLPPAGIPGVVSVNALDRDFEPWDKSVTLFDRDRSGDTAGWYLPVVSAPGVDLTVPGAATKYYADAFSTGTSPAAALVSGSLALVKEKYPDATSAQLIQNLIHHTTRDNQTGKDRAPDMLWALHTGYGPVSPLNMLAHDPAGWPDQNPLLGTPNTMYERFPSSIEGKTASGSGGTSAAPSPSAAATQTTDQGTDERAGGDATPAASSADDGSSSPLWWVLAALAVVTLLAAAAGLAARRRRTTSAPAPPGRDSTDDHDYQPAGGQ